MTDNVTDLQDAKALKSMGVPLNTPLEHKEFNIEYSKRWFGMLMAHGDLMKSLAEFSKGDCTEALWKIVRRNRNRLQRRFEKFANYRGDQGEMIIVAWFMENNAAPFCARWEEFVERMEDPDAEPIRLPSLSYFAITDEQQAKFERMERDAAFDT